MRITTCMLVGYFALLATWCYGGDGDPKQLLVGTWDATPPTIEVIALSKTALQVKHPSNPQPTVYTRLAPAPQ